MSNARSPWILMLLVSAVAPTAAAQDAATGPISRFLNRNRQPAVHQHQHHHHVHAQPAAPSYDYTYAQVQPAAVEAEPVAQPAESVGQEVAAVEPAPVAVEPAPVAVEPAPVQVQAQPVAEQAPAYDYQYAGDPYGFTNVLNRIRASAGLHPLAYDPGLSSWAQQNNAEQCRRGLGHHVNPTGTQNCAYNYTDANSTAAGWMNSPGHRQNMLSPTATSFGIAFGPGPYWTLNAR
ncbi:MAG: hypothetical protein BGO49_06025 [Planctomycetales bacterium 71-10]|nr:MAG: hypothetical protein BGO49_06025 [Planctomycetales bacterium 71-10]